jgi:hypothetical protein
LLIIILLIIILLVILTASQFASFQPVFATANVKNLTSTNLATS